MPSRKSQLGALVLLLGLAACRAGDGAAAPNASSAPRSATAAASSMAAAAPSATAAVSSASAVASSVGSAAASVTTEGDGSGMVTPRVNADRAMSPFERPPIGVAAADVVAVVTAKSVGKGVATVQVSDVLKDETKNVVRGSTLQIQGIESADDVNEWREDPGPAMAAGKSYVVLMWRPIPSSPEYHPVDDYGGVWDDVPAVRATMKAALGRPQDDGAAPRYRRFALAASRGALEQISKLGSFWGREKS